MKTLTLNFCKINEAKIKTVHIKKAVIAGWTGRDKDAVEAHIVELEELGVPRPATVPTYYPVSAANLTTDDAIEVIGGNSSGEIEFIILNAFDEIWVGVGSDHTDRQLETHDVTFSKQVCAKPIAGTVWLLKEVIAHWDDLQMRSHIQERGEWVDYQTGSVTALLDPIELLERYQELTGQELEEGMLMFGGTLAAIGGIRPSKRFYFQLCDPHLKRTIDHNYSVFSL